jgi:ABC-2 type transport system ATP-binding protein
MPMPSSDRTPVVELEHVSKTFDETAVLRDLTLRVSGGQIYGLIGPSGCGKTTTIRLLVGMLEPSEGAVRVMGVAPRHFSTRHREQIGYTPQGFYLYPTLTVIENVRFVAGLYGVPWLQRRRRVREVLQFLELWDARNRLGRDISGGMQRRLALACALVHGPSLLFIDEPTAGLDPVLREKIWGLLKRLRDEGRTIFVSTQYIDEAVNCDTVAVMNNGRLAAIGTPDALRKRATGGEVLGIETDDPITRDDLAALWQIKGVQHVDRHGPRELRLMVDDVTTCTPTVTEALQQRGVEVNAVRPYVPTFDEVFLAIVAEEEQAKQTATAARTNGHRGDDRVHHRV